MPLPCVQSRSHDRGGEEVIQLYSMRGLSPRT